MINTFDESRFRDASMINGVTRDTLANFPREPATAESVDGLSKCLWEILWQRRWTVLAVSLLALAGGFLYLNRTTPLYTSTSRIYVEQAGPQIFERDTSGMITRWDKYLYTQAERLTSSDILSRALESRGMTGLKTLADASNPVIALRKSLDVVVGKKDEIINISLMSPYSDEAAHIVNTVVNAYISSQDQQKRTSIGEVVRILKEERAKRGDELLTKLGKMMAFKQENEGLAFGTDQDNNVILRRLERLSAALTEAQLATAETKSYWKAVKEMASEPSSLRQLAESRRARGVYTAADSKASSLQTELQRMERDRANSLRQLNADHPAITAIDAEIQRIRQELDALEEAFVQNELAIAEQQYVMTQEKEAELQKYFDQQREQAISLNNQFAQFTVLQSDYQQTQDLCSLLDNSIQRLDVSTEVGTLNIGILEVAQPTTTPSHPQKARTMGLALCLGLFAGTGLALVREWRDQRLHSTEEISAWLGLPVLGAIPGMNGSKQTPAVRGQQVQSHPDSPEAEAFRTVRTAVFFGAPKAETRTILVTSPVPGEGKSTVTANLGIAMAQAGQKVLIVDADFRRPMQDQIFDRDREAGGLSSVLAGVTTLEEAIEASGVDNLDILTCGPDVPNPAELLNSESFARIIERLADEYDRVLIDSPPVAVVTDALILAILCKITLLVLRANKSMRKPSVQACEALASIDAKVLGIVVNDVSRTGGRYGYYNGYGRYYNRSQSGNGGRRVKKRRHRERTGLQVAERPRATSARMKPELRGAALDRGDIENAGDL